MHIFLSISLCISFPISTHIFSIFECNWNLFIFSSNRFGHTSVSFNDSIYFYGGFNGQTKNDVVRFVPGTCRHVNDRETCISSKQGVKCVWSEETGTCHTWSLESGEKTNLVKCLKDERNSSAFGTLDSEAKEVCSNLHTCHLCNANDKCVWNSEKQCKERQGLSTVFNDIEELGSKKVSKTTCPVSCSEYDTCNNCTSANCMWCHNMQMCIDRWSWTS